MGFSLVTNTDPAAYILALKERAKPTTVMLELVVEEFKTELLERTARGVDFEERPFAPYSTKGPYYYYPNGRLPSVLPKRAHSAALKLAVGSAKRLHSKINRGNRGTPLGQLTRGGGIKFESYAAFKAALGRTAVDLTGPRAPHMLQAIVKTVRGNLEVALGIYGDEAVRATGHNNGGKNLPQRKFFAVSNADRERLRLRILELIKQNEL